jgi:transposase-like protein
MKYTFKQFQAEFPDDRACLEKIMQPLYGGTKFICPHCKALSKFHRLNQRRAYSCDHCGYHIYPCVGTIFEKSRTKLTHWFFALYLMTSTRHGVAAKELQRQIGCTYKTAWRMAHELRKLMAQADNHQPLSGHIEVDETYIGGKQSRKDAKAKGSNKTIVMGMTERNGTLRAGLVKNTFHKTLEPIILNNVEEGSTLSTDEGYSTQRLGRVYNHGRVRHSAKEYVKGIHHINSLEGHWSILKRSIKGTHVHVSGKHLWKYVSEFSYRHNMRECHYTMFHRLVASFSMPRIVES